MLVALFGCAASPGEDGVVTLGTRVPIVLPGRENRFLGPVSFHGVTFHVELRPEDAEEETRILPTGLILIGRTPVVRKDHTRNFFFAIDGEPRFFHKGSQVFVVQPAPGGEVRLVFCGLPIVVRTPPERWYAIQWRPLDGGEELRFDRGALVYHPREDRFEREDGSPLAPGVRERGVQVLRSGKVREL